LELQLHPERAVVPSKIGLVKGFCDAAEQTEEPRPGREIVEEGGCFDGRTKALS